MFDNTRRRPCRLRAVRNENPKTQGESPSPQNTTSTRQEITVAYRSCRERDFVVIKTQHYTSPTNGVGRNQKRFSPRMYGDDKWKYIESIRSRVHVSRARRLFRVSRFFYRSRLFLVRWRLWRARRLRRLIRTHTTSCYRRRYRMTFLCLFIAMKSSTAPVIVIS